MKNQITQIVNLESTIRVRIDQLKKDHEIGELGLSINNPEHLEYSLKCRDVSKVLFDYLDTLSDYDLAHLVTVMYAGRDQDMVIKEGGFNQFHKFIHGQGSLDREKCIDKICEKEMNLGTYYQNALALALQLNFNVDIDFI